MIFGSEIIREPKFKIMKTKLTQLVCGMFLLLPAFLGAQWGQVRFDQHNVFTKVFEATTNTVFVIGYEPMQYNYFLVRSNDGGANWDSIPLNSPGDTIVPLELFFTDINNGFIGGVKNTTVPVILKTTDNGTTWSDITPPNTTGLPFSSIHFVNPQTGFASDGPILYLTTNGGSTWTMQNPAFEIVDLVFDNATTGYASAYTSTANNALVMKTTDGGVTWSQVLNDFTPNAFVSMFTKLDFVTPTTGFTTFMYSNRLYHTADAGATWDTIVVDSVDWIVDFDFDTPLRGHVLSGFGEIFATNDGGLTWALEYATEWGLYGPSIYLYSIAFVDGVGYVAGTSGLIKRHDELTSVGEISATGNISIFPNPLSGAQNLSVAVRDISGNCVVQIVNTAGQVVSQRSVVANQLVTFPELTLPAGLYFVNVLSAEKLVTEKLIITE
jgi:photosystem II stability/assembly factor-like uncharacterized protein